MNLELSRNHFDFIFTSMKDAVCIMDRKGILIYANPSALSLFDIDMRENGERKIWKSIPYVEKNDDLIQMFIDCTSQKLEHHEGFVDYENNAGKIFHLRVSMTYASEKDGERLYIAIISDLTEFIRVNSAFERYTSRDIANYVLNEPGGENPGGQQRECSVLMSDLRGFTAMSTKLSPAELITVLNHYFEAMVRIISRNQGSVIEFLGDGIFVIFGAPKEDIRHAFHAVKCAVEMENAMTEVNEWNKQHGFPELEMGIGINSGNVVVGNIGSEEKMKYGCMGENVNLAGRVESHTVGGQIYISERTAGLIDEELHIAGETEFMPKGAKDPMKIYDIQGIGEITLGSLTNAEILWEDTISHSEVTYYVLEGKTVSGDKHRGIILSVSKDRRYALLSTEAALLGRQNIMLHIGGDLYAKVIGTENGHYRLCFTSKPDCFDEWAKLLFGEV